MNDPITLKEALEKASERKKKSRQKRYRVHIKDEGPGVQSIGVKYEG